MTKTPSASTRHFLDLSAVSAGELRAMLDAARSAKTATEADKPLAGKMLAMIFEKPSTRTRVSFDVGMRQLGGETLFLSGTEMQLGRAETIADTAKVLSRYVDIIMIRTLDHSRMLELAEHATVPVINALTDDTHPCQIMADILTFEEHRGPIKGKTLAWTGDGNNVLHSLIEGAAQFGYRMQIATPEGSEPEAKFVEWARKQGAEIDISADPDRAVNGADCVITDTWVSMNQEHKARGHNIFVPYQVNETLMQKANPDALFMHCLPAHRGEEVTDGVMDGPQSVVFDEAENRLHAQKAIMRWCMGVL
ncbi:ornithine carbamoyltransferase [Hoeflea alexandrii]|jgi:ornithine carbamoyltransferase|uniref:Ornithine carbamoyltransferase n=1 Tax=Hoeflea alexandrii TaxID=288436 RepID=A0ABT1CT80_9HYPH|nr:ornithine carbamoyltransferase [Hoeflea alexandrii]MCO6409389.1 ornithine carbamoyltransferase [Hoeflea alexandrii]MCY0151980.1 ornithine carbamoyltransferase [Hoeflea alexandrii]|tara:strand:- start:1587 stop:2510 length:924 start_codon:yes stop_codon:yes gene_type:complete